MKKLSIFVAFAILANIFFLPILASANYNPESAKNYLLLKNSSAWTTMGLVALNSPNIPSEHLKNIFGTANDYAAAILAVTAIKKDPKTFGSINYVEELKKFYTNGQLGEITTLNDDIFGLLALLSAGEDKSTKEINGIKNYLLSKQKSNGGWGFMTDGGSDSNMTAAAIVALTAAGMSEQDLPIQNGLDYLKTTQNSDGGFTYDPKSSYGNTSDASSTAWVVWALNSLGIQPSTWSKGGNSPTHYLSQLQTDAGYFKFQPNSNEDAFSPVTTAYTAIALAGKSLPLAIANSPLPETKVNVRIEGTTENLCSVEGRGFTALEAVKNAAKDCDLTYEIKDTAYGPYLAAIGSYASSGLTGWMYLVNSISPDLGASDYKLKEGDSVLWYFGDFGWKPSRISLSEKTIEKNNHVEVTVENFENNTWKPADGATVFYGINTQLTDKTGKLKISPAEGYYKVYAQQSGSIRSNSLQLKVGRPSSANLNLSANLTNGQVLGENDNSIPASGVAFTVNPEDINFGEFKTGDTVNKNFTLVNTGSHNITVEAEVSGDSLFIENLKLENAIWRKFRIAAEPGQNKQISASLSAPLGKNYGQGNKTGRLIFWATPQ